MCIIAYIPSGIQISNKRIKTMFKNNPDGAGIMYRLNEKSPIEIRKGFMTAKDLLAAYKTIPVEAEKAIHCRIATSGKISVACCHPFPVCAKPDDMVKGKDSADMAIMHNGIIGFATPTSGMKSRFSDTMIFTASIINNLKSKLNNPVVQSGIGEMLSLSRFLLFRRAGSALMWGHWETEKGVYYSNTTFKDYKFSLKSLTSKSKTASPYAYDNSLTSLTRKVVDTYTSGSCYDGFGGYSNDIDADVPQGYDGDYDPACDEDIWFDIDITYLQDLTKEEVDIEAANIQNLIYQGLTKYDSECFMFANGISDNTLTLGFSVYGLPKFVAGIGGYDITNREPCQFDTVDVVEEPSNKQKSKKGAVNNG